MPATRSPVGAKFYGSSGKGEQDVKTAQRRSRCSALQQKRVALRCQPVQSRQVDGLRQGANLEIFLTVPPVHGGDLS
jgi:hypothetical protein